MTRPVKVIRLTRRPRARTASERRADVLRSVIRKVAEYDGAEATATLLNVEAGRLWPPLQMSRRAVAESKLAKILRSGGLNE